MEEFESRFRIIIPDRTGYGGSLRINHVHTDFHARAAVETIRVLEALQIERPVLWGHSDGAVIAAMLALSNPGRISGLILEAFHFFRKKPASREFLRQWPLSRIFLVTASLRHFLASTAMTTGAG